jgi:UDP-N-acetylglucosamine acyltransferase
MLFPQGARIHPSAVVSPEARLADDVQIDPYAVLEGDVRLGPGCVVRPHAHLIGPLVMGRDNRVFSGAVIGEQPQHLKYAGEPTRTEIGDSNVFREHVTVHRGTTQAIVTRIGSNNYFMASSHVGHDCQVGNNCIFANGALLGGHCVCGDNVYMSGNSAVHQFIQLGRLSLLSGCSGASQDVPPFAIIRSINCVVGANVVGMRRAGLSHAQIDGVRRAFRILFFERQTLTAALAQVEAQLGAFEAVQELIAFIRASDRGVVRTWGRAAA